MNEKDYKFGHYSIIPDVVLFSEKLSSNEKVLYSVILSLSNKEGYCYATNKYLGKLFNVNNRTISRWISKLRTQNFIREEIEKSDKEEFVQRRLFIKQEPYGQNNQYTYGQKCHRGIDKSVKYNNIKINSINNNKGSFMNYEQRSYSDEFLESLYIN